jgi:hypothetical protein
MRIRLNPVAAHPRGALPKPRSADRRVRVFSIRQRCKVFTAAGLRADMAVRAPFSSGQHAPSMSPPRPRASRTSARFWSAPVLWRFGHEEQRTKSGRGLPQSKTLARFYTHPDMLLTR